MKTIGELKNSAMKIADKVKEQVPREDSSILVQASENNIPEIAKILKGEE